MDEINQVAVPQCDWVEAAIAYVTDEKTLLKECLDHNKRLALWGRYDYSVPIACNVLRRFLERNSVNFVLRLVPDIFHSKIIWWHDYGAYIGSANLTYSAWFQNFEAGVFLTETELEENGLADALRDFFLEVDAASHALTKDVLEEMIRWTHDRNQTVQVEAEKRFESDRKLPRLESLLSINRKPTVQRYRDDFLKEWNDTRQILLALAPRVIEHLPAWLEPGIPAGAQTDRFLHSYYVEIAGGTNEGVDREHSANRSDPDRAVRWALQWWKEQKTAPANADVLLRDWFPVVERLLAKDRLKTLTADEFADLCAHVHAMHDHSLRVSWKSYGLKERIFEASYNPERKIPHLGLGALGEMAGWAHPDEFPPRNGRTSKSLRALGFNVRIHSESVSQ